MTVHVKKKLISVLVTSGLWDWGLPVALEVDEQLVTQFHGKKKLLFFLKKLHWERLIFLCLFVVYLFIFLAKQTKRPEKYLSVNLVSFI